MNNNLKTSLIKKHIRRVSKNKDKNLVFKISFYTTIIIGLFIVTTTILQINWFIEETPQPVLTWIVAQPYVGVFFIPFILLSLFVSTAITNMTKQVSIKLVLNDTHTLFEFDEIKKNHYEAIQTILMDANEIKQKEIKLKQQKIIQQSELVAQLDNKPQEVLKK